MSSLNDLPRDEYAFPGPLRDRLVVAILDGRKTSTTALLAETQHEGEPLPSPGDRRVVVDSDDRPVCITEVTEVRVVHLDEVDLAHAVAEGEGYGTVARWRAAHEEFWHSPLFRAALGDLEFAVDDATPVVLERFSVLPLSAA